MEVHDRLRNGEAPLPWCESCGHHFFYPRQVCPRCFSQRVRFKSVPGPFVTISSAVVWRHHLDVFSADTPVLMIAAAYPPKGSEVVVIAEGVGWEESDRPSAGETVSYSLHRRPNGIVLPVFMPGGSAHTGETDGIASLSGEIL